MQRQVAEHHCGSLISFDVGGRVDRDKMRAIKALDYHLIDYTRDLAICISIADMHLESRAFDCEVLTNIYTKTWSEATVEKLLTQKHTDVSKWLSEMKAKYNIWEPSEADAGETEMAKIALVLGFDVEGIYVDGNKLVSEPTLELEKVLKAMGHEVEIVDANEDWLTDVNDVLPDTLAEVVKTGDEYAATFEDEFKETPPVPDVPPVTDDPEDDEELEEADLVLIDDGEFLDPHEPEEEEKAPAEVEEAKTEQESVEKSEDTPKD